MGTKSMQTGRPVDTTHALVWASWMGQRPADGWALFDHWGEQGLAFDGETFGQLLSDASFSRNAPAESRLLHRMEESCAYEDLTSLFTWAAGSVQPAPGPKIDMKFDVRVIGDNRARGTHVKFAALVAHIVTADVGGVMPILSSVSVFAELGGLGGLKSYLKVSGSRADKFDEAVRSRPPQRAEIAVEYGSFIGTTTIRLAARARVKSQTVHVLGFEVEPVHVVVSRWLIELARLSWAAEVWAGVGADSARRAADEFGHLSWRFVFFDHRGTKFHQDLTMLEAHQVLAPGGLVVADNVLRPGAPLLLWHVYNSNSYESVTWAFMDNTPFPGEDWLTVATYSGGPGWRRPWPPANLERLSWDSDRWRRKSQEGGLRVSDWSAFAHHAAEELAKCGIEAQPWYDPNAPPPEPEDSNNEEHRSNNEEHHNEANAWKDQDGHGELENVSDHFFNGLTADTVEQWEHHEGNARAGADEIDLGDNWDDSQPHF